MQINEHRITSFLDKCRSLKNEDCWHEIEALMVGGSVSKAKFDSFSDIDLFLLVEGDDVHNFINTKMRDMAAIFGPVMIYRGPVFIESFGYSVTVLYDPPFVCQFNINNRRTLTRNPMRGQESLILFDRTGFLSEFLEGSKGISIDVKEVFVSAFNFFWLRSLNVWKDIRRGHLWLAIRHLTEMRDQMFVLKRLMYECPPPGLNFKIPSKNIETDLGPELVEVFRYTICNYSTSSLVDVLKFCIRSYLEDAKAFTAKQSINFDAELANAANLAALILVDLEELERQGDFGHVDF